MYYSGYSGFAAGIDIDQRTHRRPGSGQTADNSRSYIADALTDQLPVAIVFGFGDVVGNHGGEQGIDGTQQRQCQR